MMLSVLCPLLFFFFCRFEMPYNVWCGGCGIHIARGKRYNAEKKQVGKYFSTPIYQFRMRCHLCPNYMEIKTDPEVPTTIPAAAVCAVVRVRCGEWC